MHIVEFDNYNISLTEEAALIKPIRDIWNADKTKTKDKALQQFSVIYFLADPRSSYNYILDDKERLKEIIRQEGLSEDFKIDIKLKNAIDEYRKHVTTTSFLLLQDTKTAVDKVREFLRNVDLYATDDKGKPLYTINSITTTIKQVPQLAKDLVEAERTITKEIEEQGRARGGSEAMTLFDSGINLD